MLNTKELKEEELCGKRFFIADNFLLEPDAVNEAVFTKLGKIHHIEKEEFHWNCLFFIDRRKQVHGTFAQQLHDFVKEVWGNVEPVNQHALTNETLLFDEPFNDPEKDWWRPHTDENLVNIVIYMNKDAESCGTNFYDPDVYWNYRYFYGKEHEQPWIPKNDLKRIKHVEGVYNRMIMFDGNIPHGMNLTKGKFIKSNRNNISSFYRHGDTIY